MLTGKIREYLDFSRRCIALLSGRRTLFVLFVALSFTAAMTEGVSISLLVPVLEAQGQIGSFRGIPLLGHVSAFFAAFSPNQRIELFAAAMAMIMVLRSALSFLVDLLAQTMPLQWEQNLNIRSYSALMSVDIGYVNASDIGVLQNALYGWPRRVSDMLSSFAIVVTNLMTLGVYLCLMLLVSWPLTLLAVAFVLSVSALLKHFTTGALYRAGERISEAANRVNQLTLESMTGMKLVRLSAAESLMAGLYAQRLAEFMVNVRSTARIQAFTAPLLSMFAGLFICALLFGNALVQDESSTLWFGSILLFLFLMFRLMGPVSSINTARNRIIGQMHAFTVLMDFYRETEQRRQPNGDMPAAPLREGVIFENVTFRYKPDEPDVIRNVSAAIERGKMVAVVGPSGAGKSTLMALIARLYDPQHGRVTVDGIDLRELDMHSWRRRVSVVTQDIFIFNDTVANNIRFGRGDIAMDRVRAAAELAAASEFICELPQGYDTILGDRGVRLSGGQQQRIAIARAILADPDLLIFDEATSNLDTFTERAIQHAMEQISHKRTVLVIAHRLSTIRRADKIIVLEAGAIVEEGSHRELLRRRGIYWEMVEHQRLDLVEGDAEAAMAEARG
ncbi:MAG TPA: ABC transporter ATP-binding protein/permease [Xanthobacteraceae bacterium]|nr:ABC transporter ATP-binding protein/permease [Xanthobacteraceae bacterium]